mgnify:CR=1 FL=1
MGFHVRNVPHNELVTAPFNGTDVTRHYFRRQPIVLRYPLSHILNKRTDRVDKDHITSNKKLMNPGVPAVATKVRGVLRLFLC